MLYTFQLPLEDISLLGTVLQMNTNRIIAALNAQVQAQQQSAANEVSELSSAIKTAAG